MARIKNKRKPNRFLLFFYKIERAIINHLDIAILLILLALLAFTSYSLKNLHWQIDKKNSNLESIADFKGQLVKEGNKIAIEKARAKGVSIQQWDVYENKWYGYKINYPSDWQKPSYEKAKVDSNWEYRYMFRKTAENATNDLFSGFDIIVYSVVKTNGFFETEEFPPHKKDIEGKLISNCLRINGHIYENEEFPAEEIYIPSNDCCFYPGFFFTLTRDNYIYNIIPVPQRSLSEKIDLKKETLSEFPEFFEAVKDFELIDIVRPKPLPPRPTAPKPVSYKIENGRMVCAKEKDKPSKSKKGKKLHLDMECCLDPDEYPNPWCYYPLDKYGKVLEKIKNRK